MLLHTSTLGSTYGGKVASCSGASWVSRGKDSPLCVKPAPVIVSEHRKGERGACSSITQKTLLARTNCSLAMLTDKELWRVRPFVERRQATGLCDKTSHRRGVCLIRCARSLKPSRSNARESLSLLLSLLPKARSRSMGALNGSLVTPSRRAACASLTAKFNWRMLK